MKKRIHRVYEMTNAEIRCAIWSYLKAADQPIPQSPADFAMSENCDEGMTITFLEEVEVAP